MRSYFRITIILFVASFFAGCLVSLQADFAKVSVELLRRCADVLFVSAILSLCSYTLRAIRWRWYLGWIGHPLGFCFSAATYVAGFAFSLSPGRVGEIMRARYYVAKGVPIEHVIAVLSVERLLDVIVMFALAALGLASFQLHGEMSWSLAILTAVGLALLMALLWRAIVNFAQTRAARSRLLGRIYVRLTGALNAARALLGLRAALLGFVTGASAWFLESIGLCVICASVDAAHFDVLAIIGIYGTAVLLGALSLLPGGLGSTESVMTALLATVGYEVADALMIVLAFRFSTLWFGVLMGLLSIAALRLAKAIEAVGKNVSWN